MIRDPLRKLLILGAAALALGLAGCGKKADSGETPAAAAVPAPNSPEAQAAIARDAAAAAADAAADTNRDEDAQPPAAAAPATTPPPAMPPTAPPASAPATPPKAAGKT
jgi:hypothetical protein